MLLVLNWNINSLNLRLGHLLYLLEEKKPDIVCLQEIKSIEQFATKQEIENLGYNIVINGQKSYNGVAILSKFPIEETFKEFPKNPDVSQARYIESVISVNSDIWRIISLYVPNGNLVNSEKYIYKLNFLNSFYDHVNNLLKHNEKLIICGDYNIAPFNHDVYDPAMLQNEIGFSFPERKSLRRLLYNGLHDAWSLKRNAEFFNKQDKKKDYTWWDYRGGCFQKNIGMKIDHILLSSQACDHMEDFFIDLETRAKEKPSDHAPIFARFKL